eukprot:GHVU01051378.1.p1 GENE.GHVU01051378.1~~GHVU01051378.1.p1  ORF type:complete len:221 (-),score=19.62 GHVU01051378.1:140-775(-)
MGTDIMDKNRSHLLAHASAKRWNYPRSPRTGRPLELWECIRPQWTGSKVYSGEVSYMEPGGLLPILSAPVTDMQSWILRINTCQLLYEQLVLYEYYGQATFNVRQLIVPAVVRDGLRLMMRSSPHTWSLAQPPYSTPMATEPGWPLHMPHTSTCYPESDILDASSQSDIELDDLVDMALAQRRPPPSTYVTSRARPAGGNRQQRQQAISYW